MNEEDTPVPAASPAQPLRRRFGAWVAPVALLAALGFILIMSRRSPPDPDLVPLARSTAHVIPLPPHLEEVPTGWHGPPQPYYLGPSASGFARRVIWYNLGRFVHNQTDLYLPDSVAINLTRTYRSQDGRSRSFGVGATDSYEIYLGGDSFPFTYMVVVMPDDSLVHYHRISPGTSYTNAVYRSDSRDKAYGGSTIRWTGHGWDLRMRDGTVMFFPPSYAATHSGQQAVLRIRDSAGRQLIILRDRMGNKLQVTSPDGATVWFTNDAKGRIIRAEDNAGRTLRYAYDWRGRLAAVLDANRELTRYTYDDHDNMLTITRPDGKVWARMTYDGHGRIASRTDINGQTVRYSYTTDQYDDIVATGVLYPDQRFELFSWSRQGAMLSDLRGRVGLPLGAAR